MTFLLEKILSTSKVTVLPKMLLAVPAMMKRNGTWLPKADNFLSAWLILVVMVTEKHEKAHTVFTDGGGTIKECLHCRNKDHC